MLDTEPEHLLQPLAGLQPFFCEFFILAMEFFLGTIESLFAGRGRSFSRPSESVWVGQGGTPALKGALIWHELRHAERPCPDTYFSLERCPSASDSARAQPKRSEGAFSL